MRFFCLILALLSCGALLAESPRELEKGDFAWGIQLEPGTGSPLYQLPLPLAVYQGVSRADLGDLRLFNGKGHLLPHELSLPTLQLPGRERRQPVALFPLYGSREADLQLLSMRISRSNPAESMSLEQHQIQRTRDEVLRGYLLQLWQGDQRPAIQRLQLHWPEPPQGFIQRLKLEQSDDLDQWRPVAVPAVMADLAYAGERLVKAEIQLNGQTQRFLRLTPAEGDMPLELSAIDAVMIDSSPAARPQEEAVIETIHRGEQAGEYLFEIPGPLPVNRMDLLPAEPNTLTRATLYSRATTDAPWLRRSQGTIYRLLVQGTPLEQTALSVGRVNDRYWRLLVDAAGGGLGEQKPLLRVSWIPHQLRFSARGEGPFLLAYGSVLAGPNPPGSLLSGFSQSEQQRLVSEQITAGQAFALAGPAALTPQRVYDWKQWSLWGVLVLATLLLGWMAWTTLRQMIKPSA